MDQSKERYIRDIKSLSEKTEKIKTVEKNRKGSRVVGTKRKT